MGNTTVAATDISGSWADVDNAGVQPLMYGGLLITGASTGGRRWRSEIVLRSREQVGGPKPDYIQVLLGDTVEIEFEVRTSGFNGLPYAASTTIMQLHGPTMTGAWPGPPVTLSVRGGSLRLAGGYIVPTENGGTRNDLGSTVQPYPAGHDNKWRHVKVRIYVDGPGLGEVSAQVDGADYATSWRPTAGTWYVAGGNSHQYQYLKVGCYGYCDDSDIPTSLQVRHRGITVLHTRGNSPTRYGEPYETKGPTMASERYDLVPKPLWRYLSPAFRGLDTDLTTLETGTQVDEVVPAPPTETPTKITNYNRIYCNTSTTWPTALMWTDEANINTIIRNPSTSEQSLFVGEGVPGDYNQKGTTIEVPSGSEYVTGASSRPVFGRFATTSGYVHVYSTKQG